MREPLEFADAVPLVDHHCHGVVRADLDRDAFEALLTEAGTPPGPGESRFDSQVGLAVRRWCAPVLDLPADAPAADYLERRRELGADEVNRRMLRAAGVSRLLVDGGFRPDELTTEAELAALSGAEVGTVVRLEHLAEQLTTTAAGFADDFRSALAERDAVAVKSIAAYRVGLDLAGERPTDAEVRAAADRWLRSTGPGRAEPGRAGPRRLADPVLHRFLIWCGIDRGLPVQLHCGYGDPDLDLHRADPLLLTNLLRATASSGVPVMLLHNYPFHRNAGYLAQVFPHVYVDVGLATHAVGSRAPAVLAELLELAPFGRVLYSSDAFGLAEFYLLGAVLFRLGLAEFLRDTADAERIVTMISSANAHRAYRLA
ncbi:amidohydrolase family protein [Labedaea rhizosphaerae]|uniref:Amidohydrolase-related domain-containing protein n=1 Tax=Labedaea rhizosphaerae TaxID=598644 RepID=A0A4R6SKI2_LABRH|nr:amidohydrolase family protein [Labedaea rhizosphaerae]TDQ01469.1 hypothetical protein EV186_1021338 [Labedaea rhizosphaerae]